MKRNFRKSTEQKSSDLELKLKNRELARELRKAKKLSQKSPIGAAELSESSQSSEEETAFSENPGTSKSGVIEEEEDE